MLGGATFISQLPTMYNQAREIVKVAKSVYDDLFGHNSNVDRISAKKQKTRGTDIADSSGFGWQFRNGMFIDSQGEFFGSDASRSWVQQQSWYAQPKSLSDRKMRAASRFARRWNSIVVKLADNPDFQDLMSMMRQGGGLINLQLTGGTRNGGGTRM